MAFPGNVELPKIAERSELRFGCSKLTQALRLFGQASRMLSDCCVTTLIALWKPIGNWIICTRCETFLEGSVPMDFDHSALDRSSHEATSNSGSEMGGVSLASKLFYVASERNRLLLWAGSQRAFQGGGEGVSKGRRLFGKAPYNHSARRPFPFLLI